MNYLLIYAFLFFIGCLAGWGIELIYRRFFSKNNPDHKWINPGFLTGPWLPIYGFGLCLMYVISGLIMIQPVSGNKVVDTVLILLIMMLVMTLIELIGGYIFVHYFDVRLWDYSDEKWNVKGLICPKFSLFWGLLGCFYYFVINPYVLDGIIWLSQHLTFSFFIGAFFGIFGVDVFHSFQLVSRMRAFAEEKQIKVHYEELKAFVARQREESREKARFLFPFKSRESLRESLEQYVQSRRR